MAIEKTITINVKSSKAEKELKKTNKALDKTSRAGNSASAAATKTGAAMGGLATASGTAAGGLASVGGAVGGAAVGLTALKTKIQATIVSLKTMRVAVMATGIGALLILLTSLKQAFTRSEEGQNKFAKLMGVIGSVTGNLLDILADLGEGLISVFEDPKQAIIDFKDLIVENITNRFNAILDTVGFLGSAIKKVFSRDFSGALDDAKKASSSFVDSFTGVKNSIDKAKEATKGFIEEQKKEIGQAAEVADMRAKADKIERKLIVDRSKLESEIANLRLKSRQEEEFSAAERKQALLDAQKLEEQLLDKETQFLELRRDAQILENTFSRSNKENLTKEAEAIAAVNRQQAARANSARQVQREVNTISKQIEAENKRIANEEKAEAKELADLKKTLRDAEAVSEQEKRDLELIKIQEHYDNLIAQAKENDIKTDELEAARDETKRLKQEEFDLKDAERKKNKLEEDKKIADAEIALEQQKTAAKQKALDDAISLAGAETGVGKALLIVKQGLALKEMIMEAKKTITFGKLAVAKSVVAGAEGTAQTAKVGFPQNIPLLIGYAAQLAGIIGAVKSATSSASSVASTMGGGAGGGGGAAQPQAPSFNIVGATETSQLAEAVAGQDQQPVQAYVVANDVTTAQSLNNSIVEGATL